MKRYNAVLAVITLSLAAMSAAVAADTRWPTKPIRLIVPFPNGAASDVLGRTLGQRLSEIYGQQFIVDNRPGAGGLIGSDIIRQGAPDGYTLGMVGQPHLSNALMRDPKPYDPLKDYVAISLVGMTPNILVIGKGVNANNLKELIALAKANPGKLNYGSAGVGSSSHLAGALFASKAKINVVHVPFRQGGDSRTALISGAIQLYVYPLPAIAGMVRAGTIKALAIATAQRSEAVPDVPTSAESGFPEYQSVSWFGLIGPRALPKQLVARINSDTAKVLNEPEIRKKISLQGAEAAPSTPAEFDKMQRDEYAELGALIKEIGMKAQ
jgi:tripartite-type tricarboxylate transporter receptor subunit TctC